MCCSFVERWTQTLARHFHQAEAGNSANLDASTVDLKCLLQAVFNFALILVSHHVDEVDNNQATHVAQAQLA